MSLRAFILNEIEKYAGTKQFFEIGIVDDVDIEKGFISVKIPLFDDKYDKIPISGLALSSNEGVVKVPKKGDVVLMFKARERWFIVGYVFDLINGQLPQLIKEVGEIVSKNSGSVVRQKPDGTLLIMNKEGYGIKIKPDGSIEIRGTSIDFYQTPFPEKGDEF